MQYTAARPGPEKLESDDFLQIFCDNEHYEFTRTMHHALSSEQSVARLWQLFLQYIHLYSLVGFFFFFLPLNVIQTFIKFSSFNLRDQRHQ